MKKYIEATCCNWTERPVVLSVAAARNCRSLEGSAVHECIGDAGIADAVLQVLRGPQDLMGRTQDRAVDVRGKLHVAAMGLPLVPELRVLVLVAPRLGAEAVELLLDRLSLVPSGRSHRAAASFR